MSYRITIAAYGVCSDCRVQAEVLCLFASYVRIPGVGDVGKFSTACFTEFILFRVDILVHFVSAMHFWWYIVVYSSTLYV